MSEQHREVVLCGPLGPVGILFREMLIRDTKNQTYYISQDSDGALMHHQYINYPHPHSIVCDLNSTPVRQALDITYCLRTKFPRTGLIILRENAELERYSNRFQFTTVFAAMLHGMFWRPKATNCILEAAHVAVRPKK